MFKLEMYKSFRKIEIMIIFLLGIIFEIVASSMSNNIVPQNVNLKIYRYYIDKLEGEYTEQKNEWIISERDNYQKYIDNEQYYEEQYDNNEITGEEYREILDNVKSAEVRIETLNYLVQKSEYLKMLNDNSDKDKVEYFYDIDIKDYVENMGVDLAVIFIIVVVVVHIFNEDYNSGTELMIKTSAYGRRKLYTNRLLCTLMASGFVGFLFPIIELITKYMSFDLKNTSASIRCLESMSESGMSISIKEYLVLSIVLRGISAIFLGIIVMCISKLTHNNIVCYVIAIALVYLPDIMYEHMGQFIKNISLCKGFAIYKAFKNVEKIFGLHNMIVWGMLYLIISLFIVSYFMYKSED